MAANHRVTYSGEGPLMQARCACLQTSPIGDRGCIEAWWYHHQELVQRVRAHLGTRTPSLKSQRDWFMAQAENTENSPGDRELWHQLADEVTRHLNIPTGPMPGELTLW